MPVHKVPGGYKWGDSGKTYTDPKDAYRQQSAIEHSGWKEKKDIKEALLNRAYEDIWEAMIILRHFEEDGAPPVQKDKNQIVNDLGLDAEKDNLAVPASDLNEDGNPVPSDAPSVSTTYGNLTIAGVPTATESQSTPVDVNLSDVREPANVLGNPDPNSAETSDVTNVTDNPMI